MLITTQDTTLFHTSGTIIHLLVDTEIEPNQFLLDSIKHAVANGILKPVQSVQTSITQTTPANAIFNVQTTQNGDSALKQESTKESK